MGRFSKILGSKTNGQAKPSTEQSVSAADISAEMPRDTSSEGPETLIEAVELPIEPTMPALEAALAEKKAKEAAKKDQADKAAADKDAADKESANETAKWLEQKVRIHGKIIDEIDLASLDGLGKEELKDQIIAIVKEIAAEEQMRLNAREVEQLADGIYHEMTGLGPLEILLQDEAVSDILINGHENVYVEKGGELEPSPVRFANEAHLLRIVNKIVSQVGRRVDESQPLCDARLADGSRFNVAIRPIAIDGPLVSIRKFSKSPLTLDKLVEFGAMPDHVAHFLWAACRSRATILISGGTGSGKTTLLNALSQSISHKERLITIEDAAELQLQQPHVARMETRPPNIEGNGEIRQRELVKNALRMRPERVILGEVRGEEAFDMLQAMNTGHEGSMATLHANTPRDAVTRLEQMVAMGDMKISPEAVAGQIASAVHIIVQATRLSDGQRKITYVSEITGMEGKIIQMQDLFRYVRTGTGPKNKVIGEFRCMGIRPKCLDLITTRNIPLPDGLFEPRIMETGRLSDATFKERMG